MNAFKLTTNMSPKGDQISSIAKLVKNINQGEKSQVLLGATGTGKTFTIANVIEKIQQNTLVIVHNKTLAAQLYSEFKELFKNNHVEYFVSYFDFYQPEAYIPRSDTYIEKSALVNQEIEMLRLSSINSLASNEPTIIVASVAAIYASVAPSDFEMYRIVLSKNMERNLKQLQYDLVRLQYQRNNIDLKPGTFRLRGDVLEIAPGYTDTFTIRISFFGSKIEEIALIDALTGQVKEKWDTYVIVPASEYIMNRNRWKESMELIKKELDERIIYFKKNNKLLEAQRIQERTLHDVEALEELGYCNGIENYSRHLELRQAGSTPYTLFDYFKSSGWLLVIDESHMTIPQIKGMYNTDRSRKETLVEYGFRLPSALDNRPLNFDEFQSKIDKVIYVSATPNEWEIKRSNDTVVEQIVRPTGLVDPLIEIHSAKYQVDDLVIELKKQIAKKERAFVTVLTIKMAENLTDFLRKHKFKVMYMHNELKTLERAKIINDLRRGKYDVIVGINLLREGLDVPEVSLVAVFDADKPGFFRSDKALIQTFGRAARNINGRVILYADHQTDAMKIAISETNRRREIQIKYNAKHHISPQTIVKPIFDDITSKDDAKTIEAYFKNNKVNFKKTSKAVNILKKEMLQAAHNQEYERAAFLRDAIIELEGKIK
ncbi:MAG: excinuclease ABC subunit B [Mycoplasmataceae bacterium]|nr:excinuclease ABC subunit B [Mycoplasmataceae bacterium]